MTATLTIDDHDDAASAAAQLSSSLSYVPVINGRDRRAATRSSSSSSSVRVVKERHRRLPPPPSHPRSQKQPETNARSNAPAMATAATNVCVGTMTRMSSRGGDDGRKRRRANAYDDVLVVLPPPPPRQPPATMAARTVARVDGGRGGAVWIPPVANGTSGAFVPSIKTDTAPSWMSLLSIEITSSLPFEPTTATLNSRNSA